jgi:hypothetical protein
MAIHSEVLAPSLEHATVMGCGRQSMVVVEVALLQVCWTAIRAPDVLRKISQRVYSTQINSSGQSYLVYSTRFVGSCDVQLVVLFGVVMRLEIQIVRARSNANVERDVEIQSRYGSSVDGAM